MTFGSASSPANDSGRDGSRSRSRSGSRQPQSDKEGGGEGPGAGEGEALSRTSSILCNYAPEGRPAGILINAANARSPSLSPSSVPKTAAFVDDGDGTFDLDEYQSPTPRPGMPRSPSSTSNISQPVMASAPAGGFPTEAALLAAQQAAFASSGAAADQLPTPQKANKIRFAPLPEIRPRAYSTGRNVWVVEEDDPDSVGGRRQRLVRVDDDDYDEALDDPAAGDADFAQFDDDAALGQSGSPSSLSMRFGSWGEVLGLSPSTSRRSADEDALSLASSVSPSSEGGLSTSVGSSTGSGGGSSKKLLKAFGLGGKNAKSKRSGKENYDGSLARTSSGESHASSGRRLSFTEVPSPRPMGSTGIPMHKSSTWEVGDVASPNGPDVTAKHGGPVYYASPARTARRRAQYPPVAQGRNRRGRAPAQAAAVEEPAFEEWGSMGVGSNVQKRTVVGSAPSETGIDEEDDGTGMAWLRKRRLQREQEQRERAAREAAAAHATGDSTPRDGASSPPPSAPAATSTDVLPPEEEQDTLTRDPTQRGPADENPRLPLPFLVRTPPSRSGTLDSTVSTASTVRPASPAVPAGPAKPSGLSSTRPVLAVDTQVQDGSGAAGRPASADEAGESPLPSPANSRDEDENGDRDSEDESEDDDLDEEELAREEALAEEARRMAKSMGAERYHSARHENQLKVVDS
ncbi:hypothetical protein JCM8202v2_001642 [Rhodotorula sphaerocarpa]